MSLNQNMITGTKYSNLNLQPNTTYNYELVAVDNAGNKSGKATTKLKTLASGTTPPPPPPPPRARTAAAPPPSGSTDKTPPSQPQNLKGVAESPTQVRLTWNASTDNVGVKDYVLKRNGSDFETVAAGTLTHTDTAALPGAANNYRVVARDAAGNVSTASTTVKVITPAS